MGVLLDNGQEVLSDKCTEDDFKAALRKIIVKYDLDKMVAEDLLDCKTVRQAYCVLESEPGDWTCKE